VKFPSWLSKTFISSLKKKALRQPKKVAAQLSAEVTAVAGTNPAHPSAVATLPAHPGARAVPMVPETRATQILASQASRKAGLVGLDRA
jgi:hypothetical protein